MVINLDTNIFRRTTYLSFNENIIFSVTSCFIEDIHWYVVEAYFAQTSDRFSIHSDNTSESNMQIGTGTANEIVCSWMDLWCY